ncbi:hypothetical protein TTHERM_000590409 (macronuclear) [Tetrahymena thermophila SB210]|uniref:Uncharacterized protein n=1 Tax=Tetrahymena thermophila (strain SB210) TaxID=312017 RepID=W7XGU6_TETTS|nr:hypothetical protein TTHERM_000590409 [Tetrahymena thermophila SB210]EWS73456.1 hypothetical protein TTHERM_000590409 [Tetrahymena thermophila SB210]|eukprot:XP_012654027.1 hypothetical protein TTHERM_000590409 [Tetrahymena thermophila SB210]
MFKCIFVIQKKKNLSISKIYNRKQKNKDYTQQLTTKHVIIMMQTQIHAKILKTQINRNFLNFWVESQRGFSVYIQKIFMKLTFKFYFIVEKKNILIIECIKNIFLNQFNFQKQQYLLTYQE